MVGQAKEHLILLKWRLELLPYVARYHAAVLSRAAIEKKVRLLPTPSPPLVIWTALDNIHLRSRVPLRTSSHGPWWSFTRELVAEQIRPRRSVFEPSPPEDSTHCTVQAIFLEGRHYRATSQYGKMVESVQQNRREGSWGCRTIAEVEQYFHRLLAAFESMRTQGYLSQKELGGALADEIQLYITKDGRLVRLVDGANHRFLMAEILGIRWIPFVLRAVHPEWLLKASRELSLPPHRSYVEWFATHEAFHVRRPDSG
jgi:hypothetical protein